MGTQPAVILVVRGLKSDLPREELERRYKERIPQFREFPGLIQKYYCYDEVGDAWAGVYLWDSEESLAKFQESDLRRSIPSAYELKEPPQVERFSILEVLNP